MQCDDETKHNTAYVTDPELRNTNNRHSIQFSVTSGQVESILKLRI